MTKKIIAILLAALLLTGCNVAKVEDTTKKPEPYREGQDDNNK